MKKDKTYSNQEKHELIKKVIQKTNKYFEKGIKEEEGQSAEAMLDTLNNIE